MQRKCAAEDGEDSEFRREEFRQPRNWYLLYNTLHYSTAIHRSLLNMAAELLRCCSTKLTEINKKAAQEKSVELLDQEL